MKKVPHLPHLTPYLTHALGLAKMPDGKHLIVNGMGTIQVKIRKRRIVSAWLWEDPFGEVYHWPPDPPSMGARP